MAKNYTIQFKSLRAGTTYIVNIGGGTGTPVQLKAGANPFVTQEDDDDDMFTPIRTQSGYLRIVDDGYAADGVTPFNWKDMIPATDISRPVTLTANGTVVWQGFMQAQDFGSTLYGNPQEREFPVQGLINVVGTNNFDASAGIMTVAAVINEIFRDVPLTKYYFQNEHVVDWFTKKFDPSVYGDLKKDPLTGVQTFEPYYDRAQVLEDLCHFFGYTCRQVGTDIYFEMPTGNNNNYLCINKADLNDDGTCSYTQEQKSSVALVPSFVSTNNEELLKQGIKKATITANIGKNEDVVEFPFDDITSTYKHEDVQTEYHTGNLYCFAKLYTASSLWTYDNGQVYVVVAGSTHSGHGDMQISDWYYGDLTDKHNYDFKTFVEIGSNAGASSEEILATIIGKQIHNYSDGIINIKAVVNRVIWDYSVSDPKRTTEPATITLKCRMSIGVYVGDNFVGVWWNGSSWQSSQTSFELPIKDGNVKDNRVLTSDDPEYTGYGAAVPSNIGGGQYRFQILGIKESSLSTYIQVDISNLQVNFIRNNQASDDESNVYTESTNSEFTEEYNIDNVIASDKNNAAGIGILLNSDGSYCSGIVYNTAIEHPEQNLLDRIIAHRSTVKILNEMELNSAENIISVKNKYTFQNKVFHPIAISHDWRDDITKLKILEL